MQTPDVFRPDLKFTSADAIRGLGLVFDDVQQTFDPFPHDPLSVGEQGETGTGSFSAFRKGACPI
jgi:hypothetical protein